MCQSRFQFGDAHPSPFHNSGQFGHGTNESLVQRDVYLINPATGRRYGDSKGILNVPPGQTRLSHFDKNILDS